MITFDYSMKSLLDNLMKKGVIKSNKVYEAMSKVNRRDFTDSSPYDDTPQYIDCNATISAPHMHAFALEYLKDFLAPGSNVLDVGSGSGYLTVAFSKMMNDSGIVVGIEHIDKLYNIGAKNISKHHQKLIDEKKIILIKGDGRLGYKQYAPYKCIHVGAAAETIPDALIEQLDKGGRMMIPVGKDKWNQQICLVDKDLNGNVKMNNVLSVSYVPLTSVEAQLGK